MHILKCGGIVLCCLVSAIATNTLVIPTGLLPGGITGISVLMYHFLGWKVSIQYFIYNVPLLILAYRLLGKTFSIYTIISVLSSTAFLACIPIQHMWTTDDLLAAVFGGLLLGVSSAITIRLGGSTGGLDIVARIMAKYKNIPMGKFNLAVNGFIVISSGFLFGAQAVMYTLVAQYISMKVYETILSHMDRINVLIITTRDKEVSAILLEQMKRGVTSWNANGEYTNDEKKVLMCVITYVQLAELKELVQSVDRSAFVVVMPAEQVVGNFRQLW